MSRWLLLSLLGGLFVTACVLPDVEVDPDLAIGPLQPGSGGSESAAIPPGEMGGTSGIPDNTDMPDPPLAQGGEGGTDSDDVNAGVDQGGSAGAGGSAGSGGAGGSGGAAGSAGSGGSGGAPTGNTVPELADCTPDTSKEAACSDYCNLFLGACRGFTSDTYASLSDCVDTCVFSFWPNGTITQRDSICCRWQHAKLANMGLAQNPHCFHSSEFPTLVPPDTAGCAPLPTTP
jgi:hypothetical protein